MLNAIVESCPFPVEDLPTGNLLCPWASYLRESLYPFVQEQSQEVEEDA